MEVVYFGDFENYFLKFYICWGNGILKYDVYVFKIKGFLFSCLEKNGVGVGICYVVVGFGFC